MQLIFMVGFIYFVSISIFLISLKMARKSKSHTDAKHSTVIKYGAALADVLTDIFLILWLHENENADSKLKTLKYISVSACVTSFVIGNVCYI